MAGRQAATPTRRARGTPRVVRQAPPSASPGRCGGRRPTRRGGRAVRQPDSSAEQVVARSAQPDDGVEDVGDGRVAQDAPIARQPQRARGSARAARMKSGAPNGAGASRRSDRRARTRPARARAGATADAAADGDFGRQRAHAAARGRRRLDDGARRRDRAPTGPRAARRRERWRTRPPAAASTPATAAPHAAGMRAGPR